MHRRLLLVLLGLFVFGRGTAVGQVAARQGVAPPSEIVHFESPMILDLPLPNVASLEPQAQVQLPNVRKYICDEDVQLLNLSIAKHYRGPKKARSLELVFAGAVLVGDSYDRRVDIALRIRHGEEVIASQTLRNFSAEEERSTPFRILVPTEESRLLAALQAEPAPVIELTLTVRDDS